MGTEASLPSIDLLFADPQSSLRIHRAVAERALVFGFSAGDTNRAFETLLERACVPDSTFSDECFASDLFLREFVERCLPIYVNETRQTANVAYLLRYLSAPPRQLDELRARQRIMGELCDDAVPFRSRLEQLYTELCALRSLLSSGDYSARIDPNQRRLDILRSLQQCFLSLAQGFEHCQSNLSRLHRYGQRVVTSEAYQQLFRVLEFEADIGTVDVRLKIGIDGNIRSLALTELRENVDNPFHTSWLSRAWARFRFLLRGYRFSDQEVLNRLLYQVFEGIKGFIPPLLQLIGDIEFYLAALGLRDMATARGLRMSCPELSDTSVPIELQQVWNPFLLADGVDVVPCDVSAERNAMVILTGPNSGGKTRLMQSLAFCQLLAQSGLFVPASSARLRFAGGLFVSMLQQVRADETEGRLGTELKRIRRLFEQVNPGDLVILDELCSGTNPSEGEEIFQLVLELLAQLRPQVWISTHFLKFAAELQRNQRMPVLQFLRVALDEHEHPTYQFEPGVAATSLARQTAARLGVTREELEALVQRALRRSSARTPARPPAASEATPPPTS